MSWTTVLQARPSGERLDGFQAVGAVLSREGGVARRGHLGVPLEPVWLHFGHHFFDVFLKWLFGGLGLHLGSQNTSKMRPKRGSKSKHENHRFCCYLLHFGDIQG